MAISEEALELYGTIVSANVDSLASITNSLMDSYQRDTRRMASAFVSLYEAIADIPPMVRSVYLDDLLDAFEVSYSSAHRFMGEDPT